MVSPWDNITKIKPFVKRTQDVAQIPSELKSKLSQISAFQGKKVSTLVRESIEEKLVSWHVSSV